MQPSLFDAIVLGIVEGLTEFLPISSTGHLIVAEKLLGLAESEFLKTFTVVVQFGAILAVVAFYWRSFFNRAVLARIIAAFVPTGILGLVFHKAIKAHLDDVRIVVASMFIGGLLILIIDRGRDAKARVHDIASITWKQAIIVGLCQSVAMIPGVSRSAATIMGGMLLGIGRRTIVEFTFLLAVPTMFAATGLELWKARETLGQSDLRFLLVGSLIAFAVAVISITGLLAFVRRFRFTAFGIYRLFAAVLIWWVVVHSAS